MHTISYFYTLDNITLIALGRSLRDIAFLILGGDSSHLLPCVFYSLHMKKISSKNCSMKEVAAKCKTSNYVLTEICLHWSSWVHYPKEKRYFIQTGRIIFLFRLPKFMRWWQLITLSIQEQEMYSKQQKSTMPWEKLFLY